MVQLGRAFAALTPFALIALVQFGRYSSNTSTPWERVKARARAASGGPGAKLDPGPPKPFEPVHIVPSAANGTASYRQAATGPQQQQQQLATPTAATGSSVASAAPVVDSTKVDPSRNYPAPTLSSKRLLDGSPNFLPVPNAEGPDPDDLAWRKNLVAGSRRCPPGRRPYHTILTAQRSLYQQWQTKIFYYHFRKAQAAAGPCTEMVGFTRLLAGSEDELMQTMPTVVVREVGHDKTRGFMVINRPWTLKVGRLSARMWCIRYACYTRYTRVTCRFVSLQEFVAQPEFARRVTEDYVYIAETDHLLLKVFNDDDKEY